MGQQPSSTTQQDGVDNPEVTWWCRLLARVVGTVGGLGELSVQSETEPESDTETGCSVWSH